MSLLTADEHAALVAVQDLVIQLQSVLSAKNQRLAEILALMDEPVSSTVDMAGLRTMYGTEYNDGYAEALAIWQLIPATL